MERESPLGVPRVGRVRTHPMSPRGTKVDPRVWTPELETRVVSRREIVTNNLLTYFECLPLGHRWEGELTIPVPTPTRLRFLS